jgi:hypothetical protein
LRWQWAFTLCVHLCSCASYWLRTKELARRFAQLEARLDRKLTDHDEAIAAILSAIRELMNPPAPKRRGIGFTATLDHDK